MTEIQTPSVLVWYNLHRSGDEAHIYEVAYKAMKLWFQRMKYSDDPKVREVVATTMVCGNTSIEDVIINQIRLMFQCKASEAQLKYSQVLSTKATEAKIRTVDDFVIRIYLQTIT